MIEKIGAKRALVLFVLAGLCALFALAAYLFAIPQSNLKKQELDALLNEKSEVVADLEKMKADFITFEQQKILFEKISKTGFLNDQNRVLTRTRFDTLQALSKIVSAKYEIKAASISENDLSQNTGYVTMKSPITVELSAIDDLDIYRFVYYLNYGFPGHIRIKELLIARDGEINPETLKQIGAGAPPKIISAKMDLEWTTMARKDSIPPEILEEASKAQEQSQ